MDSVFNAGDIFGTLEAVKTVSDLYMPLDGKITEVLILRGGSGYNCPPDLEINGTGKYARLVPVVEGGQLTEIKILSGGSGYQTEGTLIDVVAAGKDCKIKAHIQKWTVNLFRKYFGIIFTMIWSLSWMSSLVSQLQQKMSWDIVYREMAYFLNQFFCDF